MIGDHDPEHTYVRLAALEDIEALRKLKAEYWWTVDNKLWPELRALLADDLMFYVEGHLLTEGGDQFVSFVQKRLGDASTVHQGHAPHIQLTTTTTATGRWVFSDDIVWVDGGTRQGFGHYIEDYTKGNNGHWAIKTMRIAYFRLTGVPLPIPASIQKPAGQPS